jgi:hypothetical protein
MGLWVRSKDMKTGTDGQDFVIRLESRAEQEDLLEILAQAPMSWPTEDEAKRLRPLADDLEQFLYGDKGDTKTES